jgi:hypothetical protein
MSGVFQNIDPPPPSPPGECVPPCLWRRGEDTLAGWRGGGGANSLEEARHSSVLYICKYFVAKADRFRRTRMGSALSQKLVSTSTANNNTTVRFSGLEATATSAATAGGQQQADPAANSHSSQGRISNIEKIFLSVVHKVNIFLKGLEN